MASSTCTPRSRSLRVRSLTASQTRNTAADFLGFMNQVARTYPGQRLHVILDNSSSHDTPEVKAWLAEHPRVQVHFAPTSASWLNQVEGFFGILGKQSLSETGFPSKKALREHIAAYMRSWNKNPTPFAWTKPANAIIKSHRRMLDRISTAVTRVGNRAPALGRRNALLNMSTPAGRAFLASLELPLAQRGRARVHLPFCARSNQKTRPTENTSCLTRP
jgi:transposase